MEGNMLRLLTPREVETPEDNYIARGRRPRAIWLYEGVSTSRGVYQRSILPEYARHYFIYETPSNYWNSRKLMALTNACFYPLLCNGRSWCFALFLSIALYWKIPMVCPPLYPLLSIGWFMFLEPSLAADWMWKMSIKKYWLIFGQYKNLLTTCQPIRFLKNSKGFHKYIYETPICNRGFWLVKTWSHDVQ